MQSTLATLTILAVVVVVAVVHCEPILPIGSTRPAYDVWADSSNQIRVVRRQARRSIELELARCHDQIRGYNDIVGIGSPDFKLVARATRAWNRGVLGSVDFHLARVQTMVYRVVLSARWQLGDEAASDEEINRIGRSAQTSIAQIASALRSRVEQRMEQILRGADDLNTLALNSGTPRKYQAQRDQQLDQNLQLTVRLVGQSLDQVEKVLDRYQQQLGELNPTRESMDE